MKKLFLLSLLVAPAMLFASVTQTVLFENDFDSYVPGNFYGQDADFQVMTSDISCVGQEPVDGEVTIVYDEERASNVLYVKKIKEPEGLSTDDAKKDRGLRIPLNWGSVDYANGENSFIVITGKVKVPNGNGYAELRLANSTDKWMMRYSPYGGDSGYKTYFYNYNDSRAINAGAANAEEPRFQTKEGRTSYATGAVSFDVWCDFTILIDCENSVIRSFEITDNDTFNFASDYATILKHFLTAPAFFEFTAVGNGYDTNRMGAYFDDLKVTFIQKEPIPWVTVFEDDFSTYNAGDSLTAVSLDYKRIGSEETFTDEIISDEKGTYAKLWINKPSGYPIDGIYYDIPEACVPADGTKLRFTVTTIVPDNGVYINFSHDGTPETCYGYHSANAWFASWAEGAYTSPRYSGRERNISGSSYFVTARVTVANDADGAYLESCNIRTSQSGYTDYVWGCPWSEYYDTHLAKNPNQVALAVNGWDGFDGRYASLKYFKVEYAAPEPGMIALLALFGLAFLRRK
ncbi:hypothetical protein J6U78_03530 [bacterium]|nr:hypothetical protein [bacterium]